MKNLTRLAAAPLLATALLAAACSQEPLANGQEPMPITFGTVLTRADGSYVEATAMPDGQQVGIFACTGVTTPADWLMYNQSATVGTDGQLTYEPLRYWPNQTIGGDPDVTSWTYYPYSHTHSWEQGVLIDQTKIQLGSASPVIEFRQKEDAANHVDLMLSNVVTKNKEQYKTDGKRVALTFAHQLAEVNIVVSGVTATKVTLQNVCMSRLLKYDGSAWQWQPTSQKYGTATIDNYSASSDAQRRLLMIPQESIGSTDITITVEYTDGGTKKQKSQYLTGINQWLAGQKYQYTVTVTP